MVIRYHSTSQYTAYTYRVVCLWMRHYLQYLSSVIGCADPEAPVGGWIQTQDNGQVTVGCDSGGRSWTMSCVGNQWKGDIGVCPHGGSLPRQLRCGVGCDSVAGWKGKGVDNCIHVDTWGRWVAGGIGRGGGSPTSYFLKTKLYTSYAPRRSMGTVCTGICIP